ncbi:hypothetical protein H1R20_g15138, partial [Candolleomyces eurysporus]
MPTATSAIASSLLPNAPVNRRIHFDQLPTMPTATSAIVSSLPTAPVNWSVGSGPLLAVQECNQCDEAHPNPSFLSYTDVPPEVVERIIGRVANPIDMHRLSRLCAKFKALAIYVLYGRVRSVLAAFGIVDEREFLRYIRRSGIYWAGPSLLSVVFPDFASDLYDGRLELHVHNNHRVLTGLQDYLSSIGYELNGFHDGARAVDLFTSSVLEYPCFGRTVKRIMRFTKRLSGILKEIIVFVSRSEITGFLSITEYPTTLFMLYVDGISLHVLYPYLTGNGRGLINLPFPQPPSPVVPSFILALSPSFDLKPHLADWPEYRFHLCEHNAYCPLRLRHQLDNRGLSLGCSIDHPDMRQYRRREPGRIFPPFYARINPTLCIWRLRCCGSCLANMPFPCQDVSHLGVYIARDMFISDVLPPGHALALPAPLPYRLAVLVPP